ncbi:MAG: tetratricopeptide repeat protein, partial [Chitinophagaceae bacterium]|nr:tetratricopeptide repeat protein [Chitinophagaceae bacterium]
TALRHWEQAANIFRQLRNHVKTSEIYLFVCDVHLHRHEFTKAAQLQNEGMSWMMLAGDYALEDKILDVSFKLNKLSGDTEAALETLERKMELHKKAGNKLAQARTQMQYAGVCIDLADFDKSLDLLHQALPHAQALGDPLLEADILVQLGSIHFYRSQWEEAATYFDLSLHRYKEIKNLSGEAFSLLHLAKTGIEKNDYEKAMELLKKSGSVFSLLRDERAKAIVDTNKARVYAAQGRYWRAGRLLKKGFSTLTRINDKTGMAEVCLQQAEIARKRNKTGPLYKYAHQAFELYEEQQHQYGIFRAGWLIGAFHCEKRYNAETIQIGLRHLHRCVAIGTKAGLDETKKIQRIIQMTEGQTRPANKSYQS